MDRSADRVGLGADRFMLTGRSPSPYLSGEATYETIMGMQEPGQGVQACVKHL